MHGHLQGVLLHKSSLHNSRHTASDKMRKGLNQNKLISEGPQISSSIVNTLVLLTHYIIKVISLLPNQDLLISRGPDKGSLFIDGEHTCHISQIHRCLWHNLSLKLTWQKRNKQVGKLKTIVTRIFYKKNQ